MHACPMHTVHRTYIPCCGKTICASCDYQHWLKSEDKTCAFCRTPVPGSDEELLSQFHKRVELKDLNALCNLAIKHGFAKNGLQVDQAKCIDLMRQCAGLGSPYAQYQLGRYHFKGEMGLEQNEEKAVKCWEKGAQGGDIYALYNLGCKEGRNGDCLAAMRHWRLAASAGFRAAMEGLITCFEKGLLHHGDLAETLQAMYLARCEMMSEERTQFIEYLRKNGEDIEEYDL